MDFVLMIACVAAVAAVVLGYFMLLAPSSSSSSSSSKRTSSSSSSSSYKGRPLVDEILQKRHSLPAHTVSYFTRAQVSKHCTDKDLWLIVDGKVYDVSDFVDEHPGGYEALMRKPGQDNSEGFHGPQHPEKVDQLIGEYFIGEVREESTSSSPSNQSDAKKD